ncbi:uncharacterized protein A1O9_01735 [Exophiala aquamarina CBS 119918]|uniref:Uncharacterized protein n=1 Tax=Exophiala aquamarina CBS 119918 TaxID=1182545 RepID=A0A072PVL9_9EURO|nr:uncharacterized protein A1O9_01735 [Exophiala aquamarina CBS 119918]KEF63757.1 hypothetical protein A1O9_01735 [Exophiala aquamarina CBS 119918]
MSQTTPNPPSVVMNTAGNRQQVPLRDYLNARIAPFLKRAITESLGVEAEFPLQWLGECLIHQSIQYEGNPDHTNIRERFVNKFEDPKPEEHPVNGDSPTLAVAPAAQEPVPPAVPESSLEQTETEVAMNEAAPADSQPVQPASQSAVVPDIVQTPTVVNGVQEERPPAVTSPARDDDTEMGGIS